MDRWFDGKAASDTTDTSILCASRIRDTSNDKAERLDSDKELYTSNLRSARRRRLDGRGGGLRSSSTPSTCRNILGGKNLYQDIVVVSNIGRKEDGIPRIWGFHSATDMPFLRVVRDGDSSMDDVEGWTLEANLITGYLFFVRYRLATLSGLGT